MTLSFGDSSVLIHLIFLVVITSTAVMAIMCSRRAQQVVQVQVVLVFLFDCRVPVLSGFAGGLCVFGREYVACAATADMRGAEGVAADDTVRQQRLMVVRDRVWRYVEGRYTYGSTSCLFRVSTGSEFFAMLPVPPRPVVTMAVLRVGVCRSSGWMRGDLELSTMLPAPPRPDDWKWPVIVFSSRLCGVVWYGMSCQN